MKNFFIEKPEASEFAEYYGMYISLVEGDVINALRDQIEETQNLIAEIPEEKATYTYAEGKWSIAELIGHIIDTERVMAYRALRFARNDATPIDGFEQDFYVENADFNSCRLSDLSEEFGNLTEDAWSRNGIAGNNPVSVRALAYIIAGHEIHHINILKERYLAQ